MLSRIGRVAGANRRVHTGLIGFAVSLVAVVALISLVDLRETADLLARTDLRWVAATLLMVPAQIGLRALRWRLLLPRDADGRRPAAGRVASALLVGQFANLVLPARLGEPVRAYLVGRGEGIPFSRVLGSVVLERVIDLASLALVAIAAAVLVGAPGWMIRGSGLLAIASALLVVLLAASAVPHALRLALRLVRGLGRMRGLVAVIASFGEGTGGDGKHSLAVAVVLSTVTWFFVGATFWLVGRSLGIAIGPAEALLVATITTLGTAIPSAPANIGTFEVAAVVALGAVGVAGPPALALALVAHVVSTLPFAVAGAAAVAWTSLPLRTIADEALAGLPRRAGQTPRSS